MRVRVVRGVAVAIAICLSVPAMSPPVGRYGGYAARAVQPAPDIAGPPVEVARWRPYPDRNGTTGGLVHQARRVDDRNAGPRTRCLDDPGAGAAGKTIVVVDDDCRPPDDGRPGPAPLPSGSAGPDAELPATVLADARAGWPASASLPFGRLYLGGAPIRRAPVDGGAGPCAAPACADAAPVPEGSADSPPPVPPVADLPLPDADPIGPVGELIAAMPIVDRTGPGLVAGADPHDVGGADEDGDRIVRPAPVPEPGSAIVVNVAMMLVLGVGRRRRHRRPV